MISRMSSVRKVETILLPSPERTIHPRLSLNLQYSSASWAGPTAHTTIPSQISSPNHRTVSFKWDEYKKAGFCYDASRIHKLHGIHPVSAGFCPKRSNRQKSFVWLVIQERLHAGHSPKQAHATHPCCLGLAMCLFNERWAYWSLLR